MTLYAVCLWASYSNSLASNSSFVQLLPRLKEATKHSAYQGGLTFLVLAVTSLRKRPSSWGLSLVLLKWGHPCWAWVSTGG